MAEVIHREIRRREVSADQIPLLEISAVLNLSIRPPEIRKELILMTLDNIQEVIDHLRKEQEA